MKSFLLFLLSLTSVFADDLICCGGEEVFIIDPANPTIKKWSWRAADSPSIPEEFHTKFRSTDEVKAYQGGLILITASSGGVALVERKSKKCLFLAESKNAHSACLLPDGQVVIAASYGGDAMEFYDLKTRELNQAIPLHGAHGAEWNADTQSVFALGHSEVIEIVKAGNEWEVKQRWQLPSIGGHDLSPMRLKPCVYYVTTNTQVLDFDPASGVFAPQKDIGNEPKIKSIDMHPTSKRIVYHQASDKHWSSEFIRFTDAAAIHFEGARFYKIRWDSPKPRP